MKRYLGLKSMIKINNHIILFEIWINYFNYYRYSRSKYSLKNFIDSYKSFDIKLKSIFM